MTSFRKGERMARTCETLRRSAIFWFAAAQLCLCCAAGGAFGRDAAERKVPSRDVPIAGLAAETFNVSGHRAFLIVPKQAGRKDTPWVWYAPTFVPGLPGLEEKWMLQKFLDAGMAIAGIDVGESFGSPAGRALFSDLYQELVRNRGFSKTPCLLARSRGGLMLYNWAVEHPVVRGVCGGNLSGLQPEQLPRPQERLRRLRHDGRSASALDWPSIIRSIGSAFGQATCPSITSTATRTARCPWKRTPANWPAAIGG